MLKYFVILSILAVLAQGMSLNGLKEEADFSNVIDLQENLTVTWDVYAASQKVVFHLVSKTTGWVGFGLSQNANMFQADLIMGGVNSDQSSYFTDRFASGPGVPAVDKEQNWELLSANEANGVTTLEFQRNFDTGDLTQDIKIEDKDTFFIWAQGPSDDTANYHVGSRGQHGVNILKQLA